MIPRYGRGDEIRWFECEPCYILYVSNCWEGRLGGDGRLPIRQPHAFGHHREGELAHAGLHAIGRITTLALLICAREKCAGDIDDLNTEFNKTNPLYAGEKPFCLYQRIPLLEEGGHTLRFTGLVKYDNETGCRQQWDYGEGVFGSEVVYAPKTGATRDDAEDDGYVVTLVTTAPIGHPIVWCLTRPMSQRAYRPCDLPAGAGGFTPAGRRASDLSRR